MVAVCLLPAVMRMIESDEGGQHHNPYLSQYESFNMSGTGYILNDVMIMMESSRNSSLALAEFRPHGLASPGR